MEGKEVRQLIEATCPECRGPLSEVRHNETREYKCLVGHIYSSVSLLDSHSQTQESALWAAVVALEEAEKLVEAVAPLYPSDVSARLKTQAEIKLQQAQEIRKILENLEPFQTG